MTRFGTVAIVGRPNAGKSTLLNRLMEQKLSIVSDKPQTTRHRILGVMTTETYQMVLLDLPGFHKPIYEMNKVMMQHVYDGMDACDTILYLVDASEDVGSGENYLIEQLRPRADAVVVGLNKVDAIKKSRVLPLIELFSGHGFQDVVPMSALAGDNVDQLLELLVQRLPEGPFQYDAETFTNISERFMVSETVREKLLHETRQEVPYTSCVEIRKYEASDERLDVMCDIIVDKPSQKPIVIGHRGERIKKIRKAAERDLRKHFEIPVHLELFVRVEKNWRMKRRFLDQLDSI